MLPKNLRVMALLGLKRICTATEISTTKVEPLVLHWDNEKGLLSCALSGPGYIRGELGNVTIIHMGLVLKV